MKIVEPESSIKNPHAYAARSIRVGRKFSQSKKTLNAYINDAIDFHMLPEVGLYYSENCYCIADAIDFTNNFLRISFSSQQNYRRHFKMELTIRKGA